jgi:hypothetical protein
MRTQASVSTSTMQEWLNFRNILTEKDRSDRPLIKKAENPANLVYHLAKQFPK